MIESFLNQTVKDIELIVVDDGSVDDSPRILSNYALRDSRITVMVQSNQGIVAARNKGISAARGEYISIVDSDDYLELDRTERLLGSLQSSQEIALAYGDAWILSEDGRRRKFSSIHPRREGNAAVELFKHGCFIPACSVMCRRDVLQRSGPLWGEGGVTDYLKWIEIALLGKVAFVGGEPLATWRHHKKNLSQTIGERRAQQYLALMRDQESLLERYESLRREISASDVARRRGHLLFMAGYYWLIGGFPRQAAEYFRRSWREAPSVRSALGISITLGPLAHIPTTFVGRLRCLRRWL
jgi:glycosyltransferase involved in cell wall biosynthesis